MTRASLREAYGRLGGLPRRGAAADDDAAKRREMTELVRAFGYIRDLVVRRHPFDLARALGDVAQRGGPGSA